MHDLIKELYINLKIYILIILFTVNNEINGKNKSKIYFNYVINTHSVIKTLWDINKKKGEKVYFWKLLRKLSFSNDFPSV